MLGLLLCPTATPLSPEYVLTVLPTERNGRKTLTTVQGLPKKFDQKKILKVIKKKFGMCIVDVRLDD